MAVKAGDQFGPDQASFDRLPETNLIGNQQALRRRSEQLDDWLELICVKLRIGDVHAVYDVPEPSGEAVVEKEASQRIRAPEPTVLQIPLWIWLLEIRDQLRCGEHSLPAAVCHRH